MLHANNVWKSIPTVKLIEIIEVLGEEAANISVNEVGNLLILSDRLEELGYIDLASEEYCPFVNEMEEEE